MADKRTVQLEGAKVAFGKDAVGITYTSLNGRFLRVNQYFCNLLGYPRDEMLKLNERNLIYPDDLPTNIEMKNRLLAGEIENCSLDKRYFHKDGGVVWVNQALSIVPATREEQSYFIGFTADISDEKQMEQALMGEESAILAVAASLRRAATVDELIAVILDQLLERLGAKGACLALRQPRSGAMIVELGRGIWANTTGISLPLENSMLGNVIEADRTFLWDYAPDDILFAPENLPGEIKAATCSPLIVSNMLFIGTLIIGSQHCLKPNEVSFLDAISDMAANAIQRSRLHEQTERRAAEMQELYQLTLDLAGQHDLPSLLSTIVERATNLLDASGGFIYLYKPEKNEFEVVSAKHCPAPIGSVVAWGEGMVGHVAETRRSLIIDDYRNWNGRLEEWDDAMITSVVEAPMLYAGNLIGVLGVHQDNGNKRRFSSSNAELLFMFAGHAASAIHNSRLHEEISRQLNQLQALRKVDQAITAQLDMKSTLDILLRQITSQLNVDAATISLLNSKSNNYECMAGIGFQILTPETLRVDSKSSPAGYASLSRHPVTITSFSEVKDQTLFSLMAVEGYHFYCAAPLMTKGEVRGIVELYNRLPLTPDKVWNTTLDTFITQIAIAIENILLFEDLQRSNVDLAMAYNATLEGWSKALELRDYETEGHSQRVTLITDFMARSLGVEERELSHIRRGALLHDIGKMGVSDDILLKPSALDESEWEVMRRHPGYAYDLLSPISFLRPALDIPYCHHEKWNGTGYPRGLKGTDIPLSARIFAVADVWDALTSARPYRDAWPEEKATNYIRSQAGEHFDPDVVIAFNQLVSETGENVTISGLDF
ncbi:HD domain-containing phosphohydrolase [Chloroflexota bacterium]